MFTGLIEEVGVVAALEPCSGGRVITIHCHKVLEGMQLGDSVAIDGACTTVIRFNHQGFTIEASPETLDKTGFGAYRSGVRVNLERPLTPTSRIGGHYVTGHVDGLARLVSRQPQGDFHVFTFAVEADDLAELLVPKGSVAVNGISLTVNTVESTRFSVTIIPHTLLHTSLDALKPGDCVNIETDLLGKYVKKLLSPVFNSVSTSSVLNEDFLMHHGFVPQSGGPSA